MYGTMYGNMTRMLKTTVYLPNQLKDRVEKLAERTGRSEAEVIRTALEEYTEREVPRPRLGIFSAPPIEDWDEAMRGFGES
jgi:Ribbon-helix-helix protein, copG family